MDVLRIKVGDTRPWAFALYERGQVLQASDISSIVLSTKLQGGSVKKINDQSCTYSNGEAVYSPAPTDTDTAGTYDLELTVTMTDGTIGTWPEDEYLRLEIDEVL